MMKIFATLVEEGNLSGNSSVLQNLFLYQLVLTPWLCWSTFWPQLTSLTSDVTYQLSDHLSPPFPGSLHFSRVQLFAVAWTAAHQVSLSITNTQSLLKLNPLSRWCHPTIWSSVIPFSSRLQSFPASGSFQMSQFFASNGQSIGVSALASFLPMNIQDWFPLGWTGWTSLQSKGFSRVFSSTTVQKHEFFSTSQSNSHIHTWPQEKP